MSPGSSYILLTSVLTLLGGQRTFLPEHTPWARRQLSSMPTLLRGLLTRLCVPTCDPQPISHAVTHGVQGQLLITGGTPLGVALSVRGDFPQDCCVSALSYSLPRHKD